MGLASIREDGRHLAGSFESFDGETLQRGLDSGEIVEVGLREIRRTIRVG
jgi:hypothetical protein